MPTFVRKHMNRIAVALVLTGAIVLLVAVLTTLSRVNAVLIIGLALIILGVLLYVKAIKNGGKY